MPGPICVSVSKNARQVYHDVREACVKGLALPGGNDAKPMRTVSAELAVPAINESPTNAGSNRRQNGFVMLRVYRALHAQSKNLRHPARA